MLSGKLLRKPNDCSKAPATPPPLQPKERTFSDSEYHQSPKQGRLGPGGAHGYEGHSSSSGGYRGRADGGGSGRRSDYENNTFGRRAKKNRPRGRWSYMLQDIPDTIVRALNDINKGYVMRVGSVVGLSVGVGALVYYGILAPRQERKPLARRWYLFSPRVPITLVEKNREEGSNMFIYRFSLPNAYDYAGYEPVSSVRLYSGRVRELSSLNRWYTPISHPEERGFIEFAIKDCDPGRMSSRLRYLESGDVVYLGRWMKEFDYSAVRREGGEMGLICTTAGASVALQIMKVMDHEETIRKQLRGATTPPTRLQLLYCHPSAKNIPFKKDFFDRYEAAMPERVSVKYNVLSMGARSGPGSGPEDPSLVVGKNCFIGHIDPEILEATLPPPIRVVGAQQKGDATGSVESPRPVRPHILVCAPQSMMTYLCGRVSPLSNYTYWQGWWFRYTGFMKDMGYDRSQVYKFGVSTHFLAIH